MDNRLTPEPNNLTKVSTAPLSSLGFLSHRGSTELEPTVIIPERHAVLHSKGRLPVPSFAWYGGGNHADWPPAGFVVLLKIRKVGLETNEVTD